MKSPIAEPGLETGLWLLPLPVAGAAKLMVTVPFGASSVSATVADALEPVFLKEALIL